MLLCVCYTCGADMASQPAVYMIATEHSADRAELNDEQNRKNRVMQPHRQCHISVGAKQTGKRGANVDSPAFLAMRYFNVRVTHSFPCEGCELTSKRTNSQGHFVECIIIMSGVKRRDLWPLWVKVHEEENDLHNYMTLTQVRTLSALALYKCSYFGR